MVNSKINFGLIYLKFIYFIRYFADTLFGTFTVLYLSQIGLREGMIGTISSITTFTTLVFNPIWMLVCKNGRARHLLLIILCIFQGVFIAIYGETSSTIIIMLLTALIAIASGPYYNLLEAYGVSFCETHNKPYSSLRVMGAIAALIAVPIGGYLSELIGFSYLFLISGGLLATVGGLTIFLHGFKENEADNKGKTDFKVIFRNKKFIVYALFTMLISLCNGIVNTYLPLLFTKLGGLSTREFSYITAAQIIVEALILLLAGRYLNRLKAHHIIIIGGLSIVIQNITLSFVSSVPISILIVAAMGKGIWTGLMGFFNLKHILRLLGSESIASATILTGIISSLLSFIMNNCFGYMIEDIGYSLIFRVLALMVFLSIIGYLILDKVTNRSDKEEKKL